MSRLGFSVEAEASGTAARAGRFQALHGEVLTPVFMPVGTQATVKGMRNDDLERLGAQVLLANTYHLLLRPGPEVMAALGGIHKFMDWNRPVLTDSGGYQIFSLPNSRRITEDGAVFRSYVDGRTIALSPESSIGMQRAIGSDIMMVLDECVPSIVSHGEAERAMHLTHRWARRSLKARGDSPQALFGIVQGACFPDLRRESANVLTDLPFDGFAIGGLAVGETKAEREEFTALTASMLPRDRPRYLMGVGTPLDLLEAVHRGVDLFDCIMPTAHAQHGAVFTHGGVLRLRRTAYRLDEGPLEAGCRCATCGRYSRAYIHHLFKAGEGLGWRLIAEHNLYFYQDLMATMRSEVFAGTFAAYHRWAREVLALSDGEPELRARPSRSEQRARALTLGDFEVRVMPSGVGRLHQRSSGEAMHPMGAPDDEAELLYAAGARIESRLREQATLNVDEGPVVVWDVGLGAAHNAMALLRRAEAILSDPQAGPMRHLELISFENDLDALRLALRHMGRFPHLRHPAPHALCRDGRWRSSCGRMEWRLAEGDVRATLAAAAAADVIFYDPFSSKSNPELWSMSTFEQLFQLLAPKSSTLLTYSTATGVRSGLLAAGFFVGRGPGVGGREESTVAWTRPPLTSGRDLLPVGAELLDGDWLRRWERSSAPYPLGTSDARAVELGAHIRGHRQFQSFQCGAQPVG